MSFHFIRGSSGFTTDLNSTTHINMYKCHSSLRCRGLRLFKNSFLCVYRQFFKNRDSKVVFILPSLVLSLE